MNRKLLYHHIFEYYCLKYWLYPHYNHYSYGDVPFVTITWGKV